MSSAESPNGSAVVAGHAASGRSDHDEQPHRPAHAGHAERAQPATMTVLVYSDDITTRERVRMAVGRRPVADLPAIEYVECATQRAVVTAVDAGGIDVLILDGEAVPTGGMGICRQLKDEIYNCPPVLILTGRRDDAWLAAWSRADVSVPHPIDGITLAPAVAELMRQRRAHAPVR
jgi:DNA-binding response OmpR family regulator